MNPQYFSLRLRTRCREPSRPRTAFGALERLLIPATRDLRATPALPRMAQASRCVDQKPLSVLTCAYRGEERILELRREVFSMARQELSSAFIQSPPMRRRSPSSNSLEVKGLSIALWIGEANKKRSDDACYFASSLRIRMKELPNR